MVGKEVVQLYVSDKNGTAGRPVKELKGFAKVELQPGETKTVEFALTARDLSFYIRAWRLVCTFRNLRGVDRACRWTRLP